MKVALVHYWLVTMRGGERVLEALCRMYPQADIFTHVVRPEILSPELRRHRIRTTFIQRLPWSPRLYQHYLPLMPLALEQLDFTDYDLVISSESGPAKGVLTRAGTTHVCYCHTPMRYLWDFYPQYLAAANPFVRLCMRPAFHRLRQWDALSAQRVDHFVANSQTVVRRIRKHWRREAAVVPPPVDVANLPLNAGPREDFYLCLGQLIPYKMTQLAVETCSRLGKKLVVAGDGAERKKLEAMAGDGISFVGRVDDAQKASLLQRCKALIFPGEEDFGIVPVEAQACGAPVLAYGRGGATETVRHGIDGMHFAEQSTEALADCIADFEARAPFDPAALRAHAEDFAEDRFIEGMHREIARAQANTRA